MILTAADLLDELRVQRTAYENARVATMGRKMELTAAHERLLEAQAVEQGLTRRVEGLEKELLDAVRIEAEVRAERMVAG